MRQVFSAETEEAVSLTDMSDVEVSADGEGGIFLQARNKTRGNSMIVHLDQAKCGQLLHWIEKCMADNE